MSSPPKVTIQKLYRNPNLCRTHCAPCRVHYCVYRSTPGPIVERRASYSSRVMRRVATQGWPSAMIHIASHPQWPGHAHSRDLSPCAQVGRVTGPPGSILVVSWPCRDMLMVVSCLAMRVPVRLCHNTACCIVAQTYKTGSSPFQPLLSFFIFSLIIFFPLFQLL